MDRLYIKDYTHHYCGYPSQRKRDLYLMRPRGRGEQVLCSLTRGKETIAMQALSWLFVEDKAPTSKWRGQYVQMDPLESEVFRMIVETGFDTKYGTLDKFKLQRSNRRDVLKELKERLFAEKLAKELAKSPRSFDD